MMYRKARAGLARPFSGVFSSGLPRAPAAQAGWREPYRKSNDQGIGRGALISGVFHSALILAAIITLHAATAPQGDDCACVAFVVAPQAGAQGADGAGAKLPPAKDRPPPDKVLPAHQARDATPPLPPAPPLTGRTQRTAEPPATVRPPPPAVETQVPAHVPPPRPHPQPRQPSQRLIEPPKTALPVKASPSGAPANATHQQNATKNWLAFSPNLQATLLKLRMQQNQDQAPGHADAAPPGGPPKPAGSPAGPSVSGLSAGERNAIGRHIMPCFQVDQSALGVAGLRVTLLVTTDAAGIVREAVVAPQDARRMSDPRFAAFAGRAIDAVMNQDCATLPLPTAMLGRNETLLFDFKP